MIEEDPEVLEEEPPVVEEDVPVEEDPVEEEVCGFCYCCIIITHWFHKYFALLVCFP